MFCTLFLLFCLPSTHYPLNLCHWIPLSFYLSFCVSHPMPWHHALILFFYAHLPNFIFHPLFSFTVILSSHPSFFYSCCQIFQSTLGNYTFQITPQLKARLVLCLHAAACLWKQKKMNRVCACPHVCAFTQQKELFKIPAAGKKNVFSYV